MRAPAKGSYGLCCVALGTATLLLGTKPGCGLSEASPLTGTKTLYQPKESNLDRMLNSSAVLQCMCSMALRSPGLLCFNLRDPHLVTDGTQIIFCVCACVFLNVFVYVCVAIASLPFPSILCPLVLHVI